MSTTTNNTMRSEDVQCRFFTGASGGGNQEVILDHLNFTVKENATTGSDDVCGQKRGDPFSVTNYFEVDYEGRQKDLSVLTDLISNIASKDDNTGELPAVLTMQATTKLGVTTTFTFTGVTRKPFTLSASGRSDPFKMGSGFFCKDMVQV